MLLDAIQTHAPMNHSVMMLTLLMVVIIATLLYFLPLRAWYRARKNGVPISMNELSRLRFRRMNTQKVVDAMIVAKQEGQALTITEACAQYRHE